MANWNLQKIEGNNYLCRITTKLEDIIDEPQKINEKIDEIINFIESAEDILQTIEKILSMIGVSTSLEDIIDILNSSNLIKSGVKKVFEKIKESIYKSLSIFYRNKIHFIFDYFTIRKLVENREPTSNEIFNLPTGRMIFDELLFQSLFDYGDVNRPIYPDYVKVGGIIFILAMPYNPYNLKRFFSLATKLTKLLKNFTGKEYWLTFYNEIKGAVMSYLDRFKTSPLHIPLEKMRYIEITPLSINHIFKNELIEELSEYLNSLFDYYLYFHSKEKNKIKNLLEINENINRIYENIKETLTEDDYKKIKKDIEDFFISNKIVVYINEETKERYLKQNWKEEEIFDEIFNNDKNSLIIYFDDKGITTQISYNDLKQIFQNKFINPEYFSSLLKESEYNIDIDVEIEYLIKKEKEIEEKKDGNFEKKVITKTEWKKIGKIKFEKDLSSLEDSLKLSINPEEDLKVDYLNMLNILDNLESSIINLTNLSPQQLLLEKITEKIDIILNYNLSDNATDLEDIKNTLIDLTNNLNYFANRLYIYVENLKYSLEMKINEYEQLENKQNFPTPSIQLEEYNLLIQYINDFEQAFKEYSDNLSILLDINNFTISFNVEAYNNISFRNLIKELDDIISDQRDETISNIEDNLINIKNLTNKLANLLTIKENYNRDEVKYFVDEIRIILTKPISHKKVEFKYSTNKKISADVNIDFFYNENPFLILFKNSKEGETTLKVTIPAGSIDSWIKSERAGNIRDIIDLISKDGIGALIQPNKLFLYTDIKGNLYYDREKKYPIETQQAIRLKKEEEKAKPPPSRPPDYIKIALFSDLTESIGGIADTFISNFDLSVTEEAKGLINMLLEIFLIIKNLLKDIISFIDTLIKITQTLMELINCVYEFQIWMGTSYEKGVDNMILKLQQTIPKEISGQGLYNYFFIVAEEHITKGIEKNLKKLFQ